MSSFWDGIAESISDQVVKTFATGTYEYRHKRSQEVEQITGSYDAAHEIAVLSDGVPVSTFGPALLVHRADFTLGDPEQGDEVTIGGEVFEVHDPQIDAQTKGFELILRRKVAS